MSAPFRPPELPPPAPSSESDDPYVDVVRRKAERMARARREKRSVWIAFAQAGTIGWQLALPLVAGTLGGAALGRTTGWRWPPVVGLLAGLVLGLWGAARAVRLGLEDPEDDGGG